MSREDFPDRGSLPRTASAGAVREGSGEPLLKQKSPELGAEGSRGFEFTDVKTEERSHRSSRTRISRQRLAHRVRLAPAATRPAPGRAARGPGEPVPRALRFLR